MQPSVITALCGSMEWKKTCSSSSYVDDGGECMVCPSECTCNGAIKTCAAGDKTCQSSEYVDGEECRACPTGFTCDGSTRTCESSRHASKRILGDRGLRIGQCGIRLRLKNWIMWARQA